MVYSKHGKEIKGGYKVRGHAYKMAPQMLLPNWRRKVIRQTYLNRRRPMRSTVPIIKFPTGSESYEWIPYKEYKNFFTWPKW
jgi:hypothetical protein